MPTALVIGLGFAGATAAMLLREKGFAVTAVDGAPFLGGGCKTHWWGGHPYTLGPRYFATADEKLFAFLDQHVPLRRIPDHEFLTFVEGDPGFYGYPMHEDDLAAMPDAEKIRAELAACDRERPPANMEEHWLGAVGPTLYSKFVKTYSMKMWNLRSNAELDASSAWPIGGSPLRSGPRAAWPDLISAFPLAPNGYDDFFPKALVDVDVRLATNVDAFDVEKSRVRIGDAWLGFDVIVSTISPERLLGGEFGPLRWMGREVWKLVLPVAEVFPPNVYAVYYANAEPFTRVVETKKFYRHESASTLLAIEIPSTKNKLVPFANASDRALAKRYLDALPERVFSIGRAGRYDYGIGIAESIQDAMNVAAAL